MATIRGRAFPVLVSIFLFCCLGVVGAQDLRPSGDLGVQTDYSDRGVSLSQKDFSVDGALFLDLSDKVYVGLDAALIDDPAGNDLLLGGTIGIDIPLDAYRLDLSASFDSFHSEDSFVYPEFRARLSRDFGLFYAATGLAYAPDGRWFVRKRDTVYTFFETDVPVPRIPWLAITGHAGYEAISNASDKVDWGVGLSAGYKSLGFRVGYEDSDSNDPRGDARLVAGIRVYF